MSDQALRERLIARLHRVTAHIHDKLDEPLDLNRLADIAHLSPWHWHRTYQAVFGETVANTVKRLRLHRAAGLLAHGTLPLDEVARQAGYPNPQSFSRTFRAVYGLPPAAYRQHGSHARFTQPLLEGDPMAFDVTLRDLAPAQAIALAHRGPYMNIGKAFEQLFGILAGRRQLGPAMRMVALYYDDPGVVPEADLRSHAGLVLPRPVDAAPPLEQVTIAGGPYAVLRYRGPYSDMKGAYQWLFGVWLPQSGAEAADAPVFEEYLNNPRDTAPADLLTDICLPLKAAP